MPAIGMTELVMVGIFGLLVAIFVVRALRPTPKRGQAVLRVWGIPEPTQAQGEAAAGYLRERRRLYPVVLLVVTVGIAGAFALAGQPVEDWGGGVLGAVIATLLLAELVAMLRRPKQPTRVALLVRRSLRDLVPRLGLVVYGLVAALGLAAAATALSAQAWAHRIGAWHTRHADLIGPNSPIGVESLGRPPQGWGPVWLALCMLLLVVGATGAVVWLTLARGPIDSDPQVDSALRIRTARVAVGVSMVLIVGLYQRLYERVFLIAGFHGDPDGTSLARLPDVLIGDFPPPPGWLPIANIALGYVAMFLFLGALVSWAALMMPFRRLRLVEASR